MRLLRRKLRRDLWRLRGPLLSVAVVLACGVATVVAMRSTFTSLSSARERYYSQFGFADVFASVRRAPTRVGNRLQMISGVRSVDLRIVLDVSIDLPGVTQPASGRLIAEVSRGDSGARAYVRRGRLPVREGLREVAVSERFALANHLQLSDSLGVVLNGRWQRVYIVGVALSPEYVFETAGLSNVFGDERYFGVLWANPKLLEAAADLRGAFNDVALRTARDASVETIRTEVDSLLAPYGGAGAYTRRDQISARFLDDEFGQLRTFGTIIPAIFLAVAAFLLHVVMMRLVASQRTEIATLKAFGFSDRTVRAHYLGFAVLAVVIGAVLGVWLGLWAGTKYTTMYGRFYKFPSLVFAPEWTSALGAVVVAGAAALFGALAAVRTAARLTPAQGMQPEGPTSYRPRRWEATRFFRRLPVPTRMVWRLLLGKPARTGASIIGIGLAGAILVLGSYTYDAVLHLMNVAFRVANRGDVEISFAPTAPGRIRYDLEQVPGVSKVELSRTVGVEVRHGATVRRVGLTGLEREPSLRRLADVDGNVRGLASTGATLSASLAKQLQARVGDSVWIRVIELGAGWRAVAVTGIIDEMLGSSVYMLDSAMFGFLRAAPTATSASLRIDDVSRDDVLAALKHAPVVSGATSHAATRQAFRRMVADSLLFTTVILVSFAAAIAMGVVYNGARVSYAERARELATIRVLGYSARDAARVLLAEQVYCTVIGVPIGWGIGIALARGIASTFSSEMYRMPTLITNRTLAFAALVIAVGAALAGWIMRAKVVHADIVAVLKTRE